MSPVEWTWVVAAPSALSGSSAIAAVLALAIVLAVIAWWLRREPTRQAHGHEFPPCVPGLPLLGNAVALGVGHASFIHDCRKKYGDAYTLNVLGREMTFLHDPKDLETFFGAPSDRIAFQPAVEQWTFRIFGVDSDEFFPNHHHVLHFLRSSFTPSALPSILLPMANSALRHVDELLLPSGKEATRTVDFVTATRDILLLSGLESVLGGRFLDRFQPRGLASHFLTFEAAFEIAASPLPHALQPGFTSAKRALLAIFAEAVRDDLLKGTLAQGLLEHSNMGPTTWPHVLLTLLWASQANTAASLFWCVAFLLLPENQRYRDRVLRDVCGAMRAGDAWRAREEAKRGEGAKVEGGEGGADVRATLASATREDVAKACVRVAADRLSFVHACNQESLRLRAPGMAVRMAGVDQPLHARAPASTSTAHESGDVQDEANKGDSVPMFVPRGRYLAIMPCELHLDPRYFPDRPWVYDPEREPWRWAGNREAMQRVPGPNGLGGVVFGGGEYRCPGRFFAEAELALLVLLVLVECDVELPKAKGAESATSAGASKGQRARGWWSQRVGAGLPAHVRLAMRECGEEAGAEAWRGEAGDPGGVLPGMDLTRLVGMKKPLGRWDVRVTQARGVSGNGEG